jgi:hypothetical protein
MDAMGWSMMTDAEFDAFVTSALDALEPKQAELKALGFGGGPWRFDPGADRLQILDDAGAVALAADVIDIGAWSPEAGAWIWGWSNETLAPERRERARPLADLAEETGEALFAREGLFPIRDAEMAWELAAIAVRRLGALGCFRAPGRYIAFLAVMSVDGA